MLVKLQNTYKKIQKKKITLVCWALKHYLNIRVLVLLPHHQIIPVLVHVLNLRIPTIEAISENKNI